MDKEGQDCINVAYMIFSGFVSHDFDDRDGVLFRQRI